MGFEVMRFIGEIHEEFYCSICSMVLEEPLQSPCEHLFCRKCITGWLETYKNCPVDRGSMNFYDLKPAARFVRSMLNGFNIKCEFRKLYQSKKSWRHIINLLLFRT